MTISLENIANGLTEHVLELVILGLAGVLFVKYIKPVIKYIKNRKWMERAVVVGIRNFYPSRESYTKDRDLAFIDYIQSAQKSLHYYGHWLAFTNDQHGISDTLCQMAESGKEINLILLDPSLPREIWVTYGRYLGEDASKLREAVEITWKKFSVAKQSLSKLGQKNLRLKRHIEFIPYSAFWFDKDHSHQHILIDMKLYGATRKDTYGMELQPVKASSSRTPSLFDRYAESLQRLEARVKPE